MLTLWGHKFFKGLQGHIRPLLCQNLSSTLVYGLILIKGTIFHKIMYMTLNVTFILWFCDYFTLRPSDLTTTLYLRSFWQLFFQEILLVHNCIKLLNKTKLILVRGLNLLLLTPIYLYFLITLFSLNYSEVFKYEMMNWEGGGISIFA